MLLITACPASWWAVECFLFKAFRCFIARSPWSQQELPDSDLDPIGRAPGTIGPIAPLSDDPFEAHGARVAEHCVAVIAFDVIRQLDA